MKTISGIPGLDWRLANDIVRMAQQNHGLHGHVTGHPGGSTIKLWRGYEDGVFHSHVMTVEIPKAEASA